ncbi:MAG: hypothetical protein ACKVWR_05435 [Acidimicrobiales bacterium]
MSPPRLLAIMGSGETAPTMIKPHREVFDRLGLAAPRAVVLDTPVGFQENAGEVTEKAVQYFADSVGRRVDVATLRDVNGASAFEVESMLSAVREADWVFTGPGSPTYALRQWRQMPAFRRSLADKLAEGGAVVFSSAAALTLGVKTVPVYEIYKVGAEPFWLDGLDLLAEIGLSAALIPHYDNAEGGHHDTRFCYLGERRLAMLERELDADTFVLGVDEHTVVLFDLDAGSAHVAGRGVLTVRKDGVSRQIPAGGETPIEALAAMAAGRHQHHATAAAHAASPTTAASPATLNNPLLEAVAAQEAAFDHALAARDVAGAVTAILELEAAMAAWATDTNTGPERDRSRAALRSMIVRLGELAETGAKDPAEALAPFVDTLLELRRAARADKRFADADLVRDRLVAAGVEVRDAPEGTTWQLRT